MRTSPVASAKLCQRFTSLATNAENWSGGISEDRHVGETVLVNLGCICLDLNVLAGRHRCQSRMLLEAGTDRQDHIGRFCDLRCLQRAVARLCKAAYCSFTWFEGRAASLKNIIDIDVALGHPAPSKPFSLTDYYDPSFLEAK